MIYCNDYINEITKFSQRIKLDFLQNANILISGGTGLIGSYLIDSMLINKNLNVFYYFKTHRQDYWEKIHGNY